MKKRREVNRELIVHALREKRGLRGSKRALKGGEQGKTGEKETGSAAPYAVGNAHWQVLKG